MPCITPKKRVKPKKLETKSKRIVYRKSKTTSNGFKESTKNTKGFNRDLSQGNVKAAGAMYE
jgi:hypothetical protein